MEKGILKLMVLQSMILLCSCISWSLIGANSVKSTAKSLAETEILEDTKLLSECSDYIKISKQTNSCCEVKINENPVEKKVQVILTSAGNFNNEIKNFKSSRKIVETRENLNNGIRKLKFEVQFNKVYAFDTIQDRQYVYIRAFEPRTLYDKIVILDSGHGGVDSGTLTDYGDAEEKQINLAVTKQLDKFFANDSTIKVYNTRLNDSNLTPQQRLEFINEVKPDICVSIHCNSSGNQDAKGIEVLYNKSERVETDLSSKMLANKCLAQLVQFTGRNNRGLVNGNSIYIIRNSEVPIALVELGFMSNKEELKYLLNTENQRIMAEGLYKGIKQSLDCLK